MKHIIVVAIMALSGFGTYAQDAPQKKYTVSKDPENGSQIYKGEVSFDILAKESTFGWYSNGIAAYLPEKKAFEIVKKDLGKYRMVVFLGTWCDDSQDMIPKLYALLTKVEYPTADIPTYGMDRDKTTGLGIEAKYNITNVPTIIVFSGSAEVGRIVEHVNKSVEGDLADMILKFQKKLAPAPVNKLPAKTTAAHK